VQSRLLREKSYRKFCGVPQYATCTSTWCLPPSFVFRATLPQNKLVTNSACFGGCIRMFTAWGLFMLVLLRYALRIRALSPPDASVSQTLKWFYSRPYVYTGMSMEEDENQRYVQLQQTFADMPPPAFSGFIICDSCRGMYSGG
jgi:hypothetical protein